MLMHNNERCFTQRCNSYTEHDTDGDKINAVSKFNVPCLMCSRIVIDWLNVLMFRSNMFFEHITATRATYSHDRSANLTAPRQ